MCFHTAHRHQGGRKGDGERLDAEVEDQELVQGGREKCKSARKTTVHCIRLVVSPPRPSWQGDLAHFTVSLAEAERCTYHA